jgi:hypothetical protein
MTIRGLFSSASEVIGFILQLELSHIPGIVKLWESTGRAGGLPWINYTFCQGEVKKSSPNSSGLLKSVSFVTQYCYLK